MVYKLPTRGLIEVLGVEGEERLSIVEMMLLYDIY